MDTIGAPEVATALGVSLPRAHRLMDDAGIPPAHGRGRPRLVPREFLVSATRVIGATPLLPSGLTRQDLLVLVATLNSVTGLRSARQAARIAGLSPTGAKTSLERLRRLGLVGVEHRSTIVRGKATVGDFWAPKDVAHWSGEVRRAVKATTLPRVEPRVAASIPQSLWHHFWNSDPRALTLPRDADYVAARLIDAESLPATRFALQELPAESVDRATSRRGVPGRTRNLARVVSL